MVASACLLAVLLLLMLAVQVRWANHFVSLYAAPAPLRSMETCPHVGVVLSLRGADPFLENCLRGVLSLDYPAHEIRIIIDSDQDPALLVVSRVLKQYRAENVTVEILNVWQQTSSLKNSALIQGIQGCSDKCSVYAWLDSDTVPSPEWLTALVAPLQDDSVGAACGIRWYAPPSRTLGNYVRHLWNSAAVLQMVAFEIGWGGAFAIRRSVYEEASLEQKWGRALVEDTLASNEVLVGGRHVRFVAECTMSNPESATLAWCVSFVTRQLQGLRYYHSAWKTVLMFGLISGAVLVGNLTVLAVSVANQAWLAAGIITTTLAVFAAVAGWLMNRSERLVNRFLQNRTAGTISSPVMLMLAAPVTQIVHLVALIRAFVLSDVTWRGIRYQIRSGQDVTRTNYAPYAAETDAVQHSL